MGRKTHNIKRMAELYLYKHYNQSEIAQELGISQATVSRYLKELNEQWRGSALMDFHLAKSCELARIDQLQQEYWSAWKHSTGEGNMNNENNEIAVIKGGNPRYLQGVQWCINKRCELLGIDSPKQVSSEVQVTFSDLVKGIHADRG